MAEGTPRCRSRQMLQAPKLRAPPVAHGRAHFRVAEKCEKEEMSTDYNLSIPSVSLRREKGE